MGNEVVVTATIPEAGESAGKVDDATFAAGQMVGRFESYMSTCESRHNAHDADISSLEMRLAAVESTAVSAAIIATDSAVEAENASTTANAALLDSVSEPEVEDIVEDQVTELEMPEVDNGPAPEPEKKKGFSLW